MSDPDNRRPLKSRGAGWANALAGVAGRARVSPDVISALSVCFAALGAALLLWSGAADPGAGRAALLIVAAVCIQLRLLCNLLDGMVAVEHGLGGPHGPIWNELPDRIADALLLVAAGYAAQAEWLGWLCAVLALLTAYVRELGRGLGKPADFSGPMAKPHRMAALTIACLIAAAEPLWGWHGQALLMALMVIAAGTALTVGRRTARLARSLREAP
ncbi:MAG TPA: CDP-alcohol phosphatidyltransferase family protein [Caulobacteraceae bacterium]|nr:CDP-alcohol phosphatidyltransferase family protein [Caulobacteraceae bacterium]